MIEYGYILVAVWITAAGEIQGEAIAYFYDQQNCWEAVVYEWENRVLGESFTCIAEGTSQEP